MVGKYKVTTEEENPLVCGLRFRNYSGQIHDCTVIAKWRDPGFIAGVAKRSGGFQPPCLQAEGKNASADLDFESLRRKS